MRVCAARLIPDYALNLKGWSCAPRSRAKDLSTDAPVCQHRLLCHESALIANVRSQYIGYLSIMEITVQQETKYTS